MELNLLRTFPPTRHGISSYFFQVSFRTPEVSEGGVLHFMLCNTVTLAKVKVQIGAVQVEYL